MNAVPDPGWSAHEREQRRAWLAMTPRQRLEWLEEAKRFASRVRVATSRLGRAPDDRRGEQAGQTRYAGWTDAALLPSLDLVGWRASLEARSRRLARSAREAWLRRGRRRRSGQKAAIPGAGGRSTVFDLARFYQAWLDGVRILAPGPCALATENHTGDMVDRFFDLVRLPQGWDDSPAYRGLGFFLRGEGIQPTWFGTLASPDTFGHPGASSIMAWADPAEDLIFVALLNGLLFEYRHIVRVQTLSDLVHAAVVD